MAITLILSQSLVEYLRHPFLDLCCFCYIFMIYWTPRNCSVLRHYVNVDILIMLYYSLIYLFLTYGIQVWGLTYPTYLKPVTTLQKRVVRIMTFSDPRSHSEPLLKSLRLLKFSDIIHLEILSFVYQWYHKLSPSCFVNYFNPVSSIHSYNTRQSQIDNLFVKSVDTTQYGIRSLSYTGPKL